MSVPWKQIVRRGVCHYPDVSDENICIVSVDNFDARHWGANADRYLGKTWFVVVFDDPSPYRFPAMRSEPFETIEEAIQFAEEKVPTGIVWEASEG